MHSDSFSISSNLTLIYYCSIEQAKKECYEFKEGTIDFITWYDPDYTKVDPRHFYEDSYFYCNDYLEDIDSMNIKWLNGYEIEMYRAEAQQNKPKTSITTTSYTTNVVKIETNKEDPDKQDKIIDMLNDLVAINKEISQKVTNLTSIIENGNNKMVKAVISNDENSSKSSVRSKIVKALIEDYF